MSKFEYKKWVTEQKYGLNEGFPIQCCVNGTLTNLSVTNANDGCDSLGHTDPPCASINNPVNPDDVKDDGNGNGNGNGSADTPCELSFDSCATQADLQGNFVNNDPSTFLTRMENRYSTKGCPHLVKIRDRHQGHLNTGIYVGANHPNGKQMGPKWITQKQSKVDFLNCILNGPCCNSMANNDDGPIEVPGGPDQPMGETMYESKNNKKMKKTQIRKLIREALKDIKSDFMEPRKNLDPHIDPVGQTVYYCDCHCSSGGAGSWTHNGGTYTSSGCACGGVEDYYNDLGASGATGTSQFTDTRCAGSTGNPQDVDMLAPEDMM